jgi:signal transduction histidine kinase
MRFKSIFARIIFLHVIALVIVSIFMPLALYWFLRSAANDLHGQAMLDQADVLSRHLVLRADGSLALDLPASLHDLYSKAYGRYVYAVIDDGGQVLFSSLEDRAPIFPMKERASESTFQDTRTFRDTRGGREVISGVDLPKEIAGRQVRIQVGEDLAHGDVLIDDIVTDFFKRVAWVTLPILLLLLATDVVIFRRALRPLLQASQQAQSIDPAHTEVRLPVATMPNEIRHLVQAVNQALDRLEQGFRVQREFTADAAHELRTPLAVLRTRLDTLADKRTTEALRQDVEGMCRIVGQLLDIAESDTFIVAPAERADLHSVCVEVVESVARLAIAQDKQICLDAADEPVFVRGNPDMLYRAVRNLAENAIHHTPRGTTVELVVKPDRTVTVLDQGPGIHESEREFLFRRFWRRDRRRPGSAGLGLAIVRRIAEAHMAVITVENRATGGASFSLRFRPQALPPCDELSQTLFAREGSPIDPTDPHYTGHQTDVSTLPG